MDLQRTLAGEKEVSTCAPLKIKPKTANQPLPQSLPAHEP